MRAAMLALALIAVGGVARADTSLPQGKGLPVVVRVAVTFVDLERLDEAESSFTGTIDIRLKWTDDRLADPTVAGYREMRGAEADAYLATIWTPSIVLSNLRGEPTRQLQVVRIFPRGDVEVTRRTIGTFGTPLDLEDFPFDTQYLPIEILSERDHLEQVSLEYRQDDLDATQIGRNARLENWSVGFVELRLDSFPGWHGESHARLTAVIDVHRHAGHTVAVVFIPLLASLLIPLLAVWLNRVENGEFKIEAFELTNIVIGGLFAVIALNFTISSEYPNLASGDNTVTRLLALNYTTLALSLLVNILLFRFDLAARWLGRSAQDVLFRWITWGVPLAALATATAIILAAMA